MARTKTNKSAAIKEALKANAGKGPREIAEMLSKEGVKVTPTYISNVKSKMGTSTKKGKPGPKKGKPGRPKMSSQSSSNGSSSNRSSSSGFAEVQDTIIFVKGVGGLNKAKQLIALLETTRGL